MVLDVADRGHGPVAVPAVALQVDLLRRVGAILLHGALEAPREFHRITLSFVIYS